MVDVQFSTGTAQKLLFPDSSIDIIISQLAVHDAPEAYRVLSPGGLFYLEKTGEKRDKQGIKNQFEPDSNGPRGYLGEMKDGERRKLIEEESIQAGFVHTATADIFFKGYVPGMNDLILLLKTVLLLRDFSEEKDALALGRIKEKFLTAAGIEMDRHEIIVVDYKPR